MSIAIDNLAAAISQELRNYSQDVAAEMKESVMESAQACVRELKQTSPEQTGDYRKGWRVKKAYESASDIRCQVHNATDYQLTHLLEDGHAKVGGGRVDGIPHIEPAAENAARLLEKDVKIRVGKV